MNDATKINALDILHSHENRIADKTQPKINTRSS